MIGIISVWYSRSIIKSPVTLNYDFQTSDIESKYVPTVLYSKKKMLKNDTVSQQRLQQMTNGSVNTGKVQDDISLVKAPMPWSRLIPVTVGSKMIKKHWLPTNHKYDIDMSANNRDAQDNEDEIEIHQDINR